MSSSTSVQNAVTRLRETNIDLLDYATANRDEGTFNDVTLQVDNLSIGANRMVLACCSPYFQTMFKSKLRERYETIIPIAGADGQTTVTLVDYMYNGQITIDNDSVVKILAGADYFQLDEVKTFCFEYLKDQITSDNWSVVRTAANLYRSDQLQKQVSEFITDHFDKIVRSIDFKTLTKDELTFFVVNLNRKQVNETSIYQAIINWIKHNEVERKKEFPDLFQLVELHRLSSDTLQSILSENLVLENVSCTKSVWSLLSQLIKKKLMENGSKIITVGGEGNSKEVKEIFNCNCIEPDNYPDLPYHVKGHCLLKLNDAIFCIGGKSSTDDSDIYNKVCQMKLNDMNLKWSDGVPMNEKRWVIGGAVFGDHLVVAGGWDGKDWLASTEYFNGSSGEWQMGPSLQWKRSGLCLVECDDSLFAFGGYDGKNLSCVERLRSLNRQWEFVAPMLNRRSAVTGVCLNGYIFAIGGKSRKDENSRQKTVERYDPKLNEWSFVSEMNCVRSGASACVLNGRIFVAGGLDADGTLVKSIECYDPSKDKWEIVQFLWKDAIRDLSAVIVL